MRKILAIVFSLFMCGAAFAGNPLSVTIGTPGAGGGDPLFTAFAKINTAVNGISQCFAGTSSPTFGGSPQNFECWWDTNGSPTSIILKWYDGVQFVPAGTLNATAHTFTPQGGATCTGDLTGTFPGCTLLTSVNANVGTFGSASLTPVITVNNKGQVTALSTVASGSAAAGTLTGTTLAANVVTSSLTSVGTLGGGTMAAGFTVPLSTVTLTGTLPCARHPAFTGDVTTSAGSCATSVALIGAKAVGTPTGTAGTPVVLGTLGTLNQPTINQPITNGDTSAATNAAAGQVGEVIKGTVSTAAINGTPTTLGTLSITAGHWLCSSALTTNAAGTTGAGTTYTQLGMSTVNNTFAAFPGAMTGPAAAATLGTSVNTPALPFNFTGTTNVFIVAAASYAGTMTANVYGQCQRIW